MIYIHAIVALLLLIICIAIIVKKDDPSPFEKFLAALMTLIGSWIIFLILGYAVYQVFVFFREIIF